MATSIPLAAKSAGVLLTEVARVGLNRVVPGGGTVPLRAADVTPRWLENAMGMPTGVIKSIDIVRQDSGTAARALLRLDVESGVDLPEQVFLKFTPRNYFQAVLLNFMDLGAREVLFYSAAADKAPVRTPKCYAAVIDPRRGRNVMVLEDLGPTALFRDVRDSVTKEEAEAVIDALAALHLAFWETDRFRGDLKLITGRPPAVLYLGNTVRRRLMTTVKGEAAEIVSPRTLRKSRVWYERADEIDAFLASEPQTLTHGDSHLGNLFFEGPTPGWLDWQMVMAAPGIRDVSYFSVMSVDPELLRVIEKDLVDRYATRLDEGGVTVDRDRLWTLYRALMAAPYASAVATTTSSERMQPAAIALAGFARSVAAVEAHDSFELLDSLLDGRQV